MPAKKVLVVFGATGNQGGSVIRSVLGDPKAAEEFRIRGITRDPSKPNAKALAEKGVECVTVRSFFWLRIVTYRASTDRLYRVT